MILLLRVDDRLLHGQVAYTWSNKLQADVIVIPNDETMNDPTKKMILKLARPAGVTLIINTREGAVAYLQNPDNTKCRVFVVTETIQDAHYVARNVSSVKTVNLGGIRQGEDEVKVKINKQIFLNKEEIRLLDEMNSDGVEIYTQIAPSDSKQSYSEVRNIYMKQKKEE